MLGRRIAARQPPPTCLPKIRRALLDEWYHIPQDQIDNLILSMPRRSHMGYHWATTPASSPASTVHPRLTQQIQQAWNTTPQSDIRYLTEITMDIPFTLTMLGASYPKEDKGNKVLMDREPQEMFYFSLVVVTTS
ncbi:hypothetical protein TNCV_3372541 [Trichonephila clavipes]|nr:hypothetical protein TNCV_3372541 [Trichonephila clavipes]